VGKSADFFPIAAASLPPFLFPAPQIPAPISQLGAPIPRLPVRTLWSAAAGCRFSVVKSAPQQGIRSPASLQEKRLGFDSYVNP